MMTAFHSTGILLYIWHGKMNPFEKKGQKNKIVESKR